MEYRITDARAEHLDQLEALERECFSMPWTREQLMSQFRDDRHEFITAVSSEGLVLGYVGMMYILDEGYISNVAVAPSARRQGIADALIDELCQIAERHDLAFLTLEVREHNVPAISLYEKHGFSAVGLRKDYYDFPKENAILMTKYWNRGSNVEDTCI